MRQGRWGECVYIADSYLDNRVTICAAKFEVVPILGTCLKRRRDFWLIVGLKVIPFSFSSWALACKILSCLFLCWQEKIPHFSLVNKRKKAFICTELVVSCGHLCGLRWLLRSWSHILHQTLTQRGTKLGNTILEGNKSHHMSHMFTLSYEFYEMWVLRSKLISCTTQDFTRT